MRGYVAWACLGLDVNIQNGFTYLFNTVRGARLRVYRIQKVSKKTHKVAVSNSKILVALDRPQVRKYSNERKPWMWIKSIRQCEFPLINPFMYWQHEGNTEQISNGCNSALNENEPVKNMPKHKKKKTRKHHPFTVLHQKHHSSRYCMFPGSEFSVKFMQTFGSSTNISSRRRPELRKRRFCAAHPWKTLRHSRSC